MAAVYEVGKKWRGDWTGREGSRHRLRFKTKGEVDAALTEIKSQLSAATYAALAKIPTFGTLADSWIAAGSSSQGHRARATGRQAWRNGNVPHHPHEDLL
jgi:hypothetical protein